MAIPKTMINYDGLLGKLGKTAHFWLKYITLVDKVHKFHSAIQSNDFDEKLESWRLMMPWFFCFDRTHYSRYGSFYLKSMEFLEVTHPGAKQEMMNIGISVRRNEEGIGQAIDLAGGTKLYAQCQNSRPTNLFSDQASNST